MLIHTVFFWLKNPDNTTDHQALKAGLEQLRKISEIKQSWVGVPANTDRVVIDSSYNLSLTFVFENPTDQDTYQTHPDHLTFVANCSPLWGRVQVYDVVE